MLGVSKDKIGRSPALFALPKHSQYEVAPDGRRFLINSLVSGEAWAGSCERFRIVEAGIGGRPRGSTVDRDIRSQRRGWKLHCLTKRVFGRVWTTSTASGSRVTIGSNR
jgi:hypothetical protein